MPQSFIWGYEEVAATALSTDLNSLAAGVVSAASVALVNNIWQYAVLELFVNFPSAPTDGRGVLVYAVPSIDGGSTYGDVVDVIAPSNLVAVFRVRGVNTDQRIVQRTGLLPPGHFKFVVKNDADQAFKSSANTLKYRRYDEQY